MHKAVGTHLIIKIDRALQRKKSVLTASGLIAAPLFEYMQYNLQYGEILSVGEQVTNPDIRIGRRAIIHHLIESEEKYLIEELPNGDQIRWVDSVSSTFSYKLYGILDSRDRIIPLGAQGIPGTASASDGFVFCHPEPSQEEVMVYEEMTFGTQRLRFSTEMVGDIYVAHLPEKEKEKLFIRPVISHLPPGEKTLRVGQKVLAQDFTRYPIDLLGTEYWIISREFILSIVKS